MGIHTIGRLAECPTAVLTRKLGKMGAVLRTFALGLDPTPVRRTDHVPNIQSVGNSATTPRDLESEEDVGLMLLLLAESVSSRMRELAARCTVVEVSVRDAELEHFTRQRKLPRPTGSSDELARTALDLFRRSYHWNAPIRSVGLRACGLVEGSAGVQLSLYPEDVRRDKWERIDAAVEGLRRRYGYRCVQRARIYADPQLGRINPREDHTVHPVGYFGG